MKVFIAGATGRVASLLIENLLNDGHSVIAGARKPEIIEKKDNLEAVKLDLHLDVEELEKLLVGIDAVYFTAGSRGKDLLQTDAFGAVKLMQAAENLEIKRFIMLSSIFATEPKKWKEFNFGSLIDFNIAKFFADEWLIHHTDLNYTIIQPGALIESDVESGKITTIVKTPGQNVIPNVARVLASVLEKENTYKKIIQMNDGDTPIEEALNSI